MIYYKMMDDVVITFPKTIGCCIHGHIKVSNLALKIIDTIEFQRLRGIKQLGVVNLVFPSATHTRFEHSIGVYHLAGKIVEKLRDKYPERFYEVPNLGFVKLTPFIGELIKIGGLVHDLGHGPFSHLLDTIMIEMEECGPYVHHEGRSCELIGLILRRELPEIGECYIKFIQSLIKPIKGIHMGALYQIVSNYLNGIDVDKFDYLERDAYSLGLKKGFDPWRIIDGITINRDGNIAYAKKCSTDIYDMFQMRYMMHKQIYNHPVIKIIECMMMDITRKINGIFGICKMVRDMESFCKLNDGTIFSLLENVANPIFGLGNNGLENWEIANILEGYKIYKNIICRKLYKCVETYDGDHDKLMDFVNMMRVEYLEIVSFKIGFGSGDEENPFDSIYFHDKDNIHEFKMNKGQISKLLCDNYNEVKYLLICKDRGKYKEVCNSYRKFMNKNDK